jgi:anhydro-N-acetylmuramic acid kinase
VNVLGVMSGTSLDGVDFALCECRGRQHIRLLTLWSAAFPRTLQRQLHAAARGEAPSWDTGQLHHDLGRFYAKAAANGLGKARVDAVGLHGQTIFHRPPARSSRRKEALIKFETRNSKLGIKQSLLTSAATFQLGESSYLVEALRVPVVSNFRSADLAAGGHGAPLATLFHRVVFARRGEFVAVNNLGGISNVTALDWTDRRTTAPRALAFDTGPANVLLDLAMRELTGGKKSCDRDGRWAAKGWAHAELAARWLKHPFFAETPPKSTGRELFGELFFRRIFAEMQRAKLNRYDLLATLTWFAARSIALNYDRFVRTNSGQSPSRVILCGGGAGNPILREHLGAALEEISPNIHLTTSEEFGWPRQAIEPAAFALLAYYRLRRWAANLPETTGATRACLLGQVAEA